MILSWTKYCTFIYQIANKYFECLVYIGFICQIKEDVKRHHLSNILLLRHLKLSNVTRHALAFKMLIKVNNWRKEWSFSLTTNMYLHTKRSAETASLIINKNSIKVGSNKKKGNCAKRFRMICKNCGQLKPICTTVIWKIPRSKA